MTSVYISADLEGIGGLVYPHQMKDPIFLEQHHQELNCIIDALLEINISKITLNDAHGSMENICLSKLRPEVELITGKPKIISMMAGLDESYSCVFLTGYHAKAASKQGILAHTFSTIFNDIKLNDNSIGEIELNAIYAGSLNIPIVLVTGDNITCQEAKSVLGNIKTVSTKTAISTTSARCKPPKHLFEELKSAAKEAINSTENWSLYKKNPPYKIELSFAKREFADMAEFLPGITRISAKDITFTTDKFEEAYKLIQFFSMTFSK